VPEEKFDSAIPWLPPITEDTIAVSALAQTNCHHTAHPLSLTSGIARQQRRARLYQAGLVR
jgi:hypothetical protein